MKIFGTAAVALLLLGQTASHHDGLASNWFEPVKMSGSRDLGRDLHANPISGFVHPARAAQKLQPISGAGALAFAALVAENSPTISAADRQALLDVFEGNSSPRGSASQTITVTAERVICRASNVDLTRHACDLVFGEKTAQLHGRKAHELYATLDEIGVPGDGAAGTIFEAVSQLSCTIDLKKIARKDGGGARCAFLPGA